MNNTKLACSLNDTSILRNLILENPELPLLVFCGEKAWDGEHSYTQADVSKGGIEELTLYGDMWLDEEDYRDRLSDDICQEEEYVDISDRDLEKVLDKKVDKTEFVKAIVVWIG